MRMEKARSEDLRPLSVIYDAAFRSNPCPENLIEEDDDEPDLTPEVALEYPSKTILSFFEGESLIGGAVLDTSDPTANVLDRLFIAPECQGKGYGYRAWQEIEQHYTTAPIWKLRTPSYLIGNICFYINKCGFSITGVEDVGKDGIGMFVFTKSKTGAGNKKAPEKDRNYAVGG